MFYIDGNNFKILLELKNLSIWDARCYYVLYIFLWSWIALLAPLDQTSLFKKREAQTLDNPTLQEFPL